MVHAALNLHGAGQAGSATGLEAKVGLDWIGLNWIGLDWIVCGRTKLGGVVRGGTRTNNCVRRKLVRGAVIGSVVMGVCPVEVCGLHIGNMKRGPDNSDEVQKFLRLNDFLMLEVDDGKLYLVQSDSPDKGFTLKNVEDKDKRYLWALFDRTNNNIVVAEFFFDEKNDRVTFKRSPWTKLWETLSQSTLDQIQLLPKSNSVVSREKKGLLLVV